MGYSGSGKDTQAEMLQVILGGEQHAAIISTGDKLRELASKGGRVGTQIEKKIMKAGVFGPPFLATLMWTEPALAQVDSGEHIIFPSSPRTLQEAQDFVDFVNFFDIYLAPIYIELSRGVAFERLIARGRADDTPPQIHKRHDDFERYALPAVKFFKEKKLLITIKGDEAPEQVYERIKFKLGI